MFLGNYCSWSSIYLWVLGVNSKHCNLVHIDVVLGLLGALSENNQRFPEHCSS